MDPNLKSPEKTKSIQGLVFESPDFDFFLEALSFTNFSELITAIILWKFEVFQNKIGVSASCNAEMLLPASPPS